MGLFGINGDMLVPCLFSIPTDYMKLGNVVVKIRCGESYNDHRAELESIGFNYSSQRKVYDYNLVK
jgi:hypothetical protein